jgi:hypothetical protein
MACILIGMKEMTSWPIDRTLLIDGWNIKFDSKFGMTVAIHFFVHPISALHSSLSHMMNQYSSKMMKERLAETIKTVGQLPNQKVMGSHLWSQTS